MPIILTTVDQSCLSTHICLWADCFLVLIVRVGELDGFSVEMNGKRRGRHLGDDVNRIKIMKKAQGGNVWKI